MPLSSGTKSEFLPWLVRRVEVIRGTLTFVTVSPESNEVDPEH
jgi:hypothetical protein